MLWIFVDILFSSVESPSIFSFLPSHFLSLSLSVFRSAKGILRLIRYADPRHLGIPKASRKFREFRQ